MNKERTVIIKYNAGNISSVYFALRRLGVEAEITGDPLSIKKAGKVIFPGVGEASSTMKYLKERGLDRLIPRLTQPVLGICLGMHLMCRTSEEGNTKCIGIFDAGVNRFVTGKVPHTGWNSITSLKGPLFETTAEKSYFYFVHSYYVPVNNSTVAVCDHDIKFAAAMQRNNFFATQFHPEKSGEAGEKVLKQFIEL